MKSTQRIGLLLALVFLLPALFFSVYELSSLDDDEKMIEDVYQKQLEAILFSVNQYSDDIISNWIAKSEVGFDNIVHPDSTPGKIAELLSLNSSLHGVFLLDTVGESPSFILFKDEENALPFREFAMSAIESDPERISQLIRYRKSGFQKVERIELSKEASKLHCLVFIFRKGEREYRIAGLMIDAELFVQDIVGPRLQVIAREQFVLSAMLRNSDSVVYTTAPAQTAAQRAEALTKEFWIFPEFVLGISAVGNTIQQLIDDRTRTNVVLLVALDIVMIIAVWLVFRNLRREVNLAQNKSDFVSNVSHEIRTPLALISMFAETLEMNRVPSEERKQEYYRIIHQESQRLTGIVNKILSFSQAEAKRKVLTPARLHLDTEIKNVLATYDFHLRNKGFAYTFTSDADVDVTADREALIECVINLIDNAMKYSEDRKEIEIRSGREDGFGYVSVRDHGVGIGKHHLRYIFDKFYRVPGGDLARVRGTGLGLSLVKELMDAQKGKVSVSSDQGRGSEFRLYFPVA